MPSLTKISYTITLMFFLTLLWFYYSRTGSISPWLEATLISLQFSIGTQGKTANRINNLILVLLFILAAFLMITKDTQLAYPALIGIIVVKVVNIASSAFTKFHYSPRSAD